MKNLFTYKNNIASGLKRYGKFLLLAISLLFLSNTAWADAPSEMWVWYCGHASNQWNEANLQSERMQPLGNNRWSFDIDLTVNDYQFFFATSNSKSSILEESKLDLKDFSPSCATSSTQIEGYNLQGKNNAGRLHVGHSSGDCQITLVVTYISNSEYIIQVDSPCIEANPIVTTGTGTRNGNNQLVISGNVLDELYKDNNCNRNLDRLGVQFLGLDKTSDKGYYKFSKGNDKSWTDYRGEEYTVTYPGTEQVCYRAFANYGGHYGYGDIKCTNETPALSFALIGTMNGSTTSTYAEGTKLTEESANVYTATVTLTQANPVLKVIDNSSIIWARTGSNGPLYAKGTNGGTDESRTMTKNQSANSVEFKSTSAGETIKITFTKTSETAGTLTFTKVDKGTTPSIRIGKQPVVSNLTDVTMNFQIADWGCSPVNTIKVYYTRTDIGENNTTEPTTSSEVWEFTTAIDYNGNITLNKEDLPSGNYNIKAVACNTSGCGDLSDMASFTITACEKPAQPSVQNTNRTNCSDLLIAFNIAVGNKALITINEGTESTAVAPQDGQPYPPAVVPDGITIQEITYKGAIAETTFNGLDGHKQYTVTCYQYVEATKCYSAPVTYVIEKIAPEIAVEMTEITTKTATATITLTGTGFKYLRVTEYQGETKIAGPFDIQNTINDNVAIYSMSTRLQDGTAYKLLVETEANKSCYTTEIVEFTTKTCPVLTPQTVTGVNTTGKVQATITMASSQTDAEYQLYIEDTPIDGTLQDGTGSALTWQVNQTGLYYVKGWFKEAPYYCTNAPTIMGEYELDCVQAATPVISINKNVICSNDAVGATISVNQVDGVSYKLYKNGEEQNNTLTDGKFTGLTAAGNYTVVATENKCQTTATSQIVTLTVIDASASVTINPTTDTTTPWVPVNFTVTSTAGASYTLVYKDAAGNDVTDQMVVVKKGNSYSLKIPRPSTWAKGNSTDPVATTTYTVEASLEGQASCGSTSTLTITLNDTYEICE